MSGRQVDTKHGLSVQPNASQRLPCLFCATPYTPYRPWQKYCSRRCRYLAWFWTKYPEKTWEVVMARAMRFLEGLKPVVVIFATVNFRGRRDMTADGTYHFLLPLNLELLKELPKPLVEAYSAMDKPGGQIEASFDHKIEHRTLEFRIAPDVSAAFTFHNVNLGKFWLEKQTKGTGSDISLHFSFELPLDDESGRFFRENFPHQLWLSVSATQPELIPQEKE